MRRPLNVPAPHLWELDWYVTSDTCRLITSGYLCRNGCGQRWGSIENGGTTMIMSDECPVLICSWCFGRFDRPLKMISPKGREDRFRWICSDCASRLKDQLVKELEEATT